MKAKFYVLIFLVSLLLMGSCSKDDDFKINYSIKIDFVQMKLLGVDENALNVYNIQGEATMLPKNISVKEAGFIFTTLQNIGASDIISPGSKHKVPCRVDNNKVYLNINTNDHYNIFSNGSNFVAYMILKDGSVITSPMVSTSIYEINGNGDITTEEATDITYETATLNGFVKLSGNLTLKECGFMYGTTSKLESKIKVGSSFTGSESPFSYKLNNLEGNKKYYFQAYAIDSKNNMITGKINTFVTDKRPSVSITQLEMKYLKNDQYFQEIYNIKGSASLIPENYKITEAGFVFSNVESITTKDVDNKTRTHKIECTNKNNQISFDAEFSDGKNIINKSTYFAAYMKLDNGAIILSPVKKVSAYDSTGEATIITNSATEITYESAKLNGNIKLTGNVTLNKCGFIYGTTPTPDVTVAVASRITENDLNISHNLSYLKENTKYYFQAYGEDLRGNIIKGNLISFTTKKKPTITINSLQMKYVKVDQYFREVFNIKGSATLNLQGYKAKEAGFIFSLTKNIDEKDVIKPGSKHKIECPISNNKISFDIETADTYNIEYKRTNFIAYVILDNGTVIISEIKTVNSSN